MKEQDALFWLRKVGILLDHKTLYWTHKTTPLEVPINELNKVTIQLKKLSKLQSVFFQLFTFNYQAWHDQFNYDESGNTYIITLHFKDGKREVKQLENIDLILTSKAIEILNDKIKSGN